ncbi:autotransporter-associated beta strand repeat-containing protein [Streptacidiphilus sp. EB103A]|uniref:autotransporter-associated beta strand repeat-containing protein n=1 Tax=Streptacidiphilus sp. EB103A TaxID=3156275 RepID=UPI003519A958
MTRRWSRLLAGAAAGGLLVLLVPETGTAAGAVTGAAAGGDITAAVLAGQDVVLTGDSVVTVPSGTHTYNGVISGQGTLRVTGTGTLVLTRNSTFTLPASRQHQKVAVLGGNHPYSVVSDPDAPAVTVDRGATLQYGTGGTTGLIGSFPYNTPGYQQNQDNIRVDGTLRLSLTGGYDIGIISGTGLVAQPTNMWGTFQIAGTNPFSGVIYNGTGVAFGATVYPAALPDARTIVNQGSWIIDTPLGQTITQRQVFYNQAYGSDINVHSRPGSKVVLTGYYSWSDSGSDTAPSLSDPALNWQPVAHGSNVRGTNIEGANVQWGDGTTHAIFMPGTAQTVYINLHAAKDQRALLTFDYDGPVTLGAPIGGGKYHDTLSAPGQGDIVIAGTSGNDVTFAATQYYDGSTTIQRNAVLRLGSGAAGGDGGLYTGGALYRVVDDGSLVAANVNRALSLSRISGTGSFTQNGAATTTFTGSVGYTGATTVAKGTLALIGAGLASSSGVALTSAGAVLDLHAAAGSSQSLQALSAVAGSKIRIADGAVLQVGGQKAELTGAQVVIAGTRFSVQHGGGTTTLTANGPATPTTSAKASVSGSATAGVASEATGGGGSAVAGAAAGSGLSAWQTSGAAAALLCAAALAYAFARSRRSRRARRPRPAGRHSR